MFPPIFKNRAHAVRARLLTWEVVTGFEQEPLPAELLRRFGEEFPEASKLAPRFWKMMAFNATNGRRHRYLVALSYGGNVCRGRYLPQSIALYDECDRRMRACECGGNLRCAAVMNDCLFILVFMEGRLCHWSEEVGYGFETFKGNGEPDVKILVQKRLSRFDEFLRRDDFFARTPEFQKLELLPYSPANEAFERAARDPFWRKLNLYETRPMELKLRVAARYLIVLMTLVVAVLFFPKLKTNQKFEEPWLQNEAPELEFPKEIASASKEPQTINLFVKNNKEAKSGNCVPTPFEIGGIVEGKVLFARFKNESAQWIRLGDSLGVFVVDEIERDRVRLRCGEISIVREMGRK